MYLLLFLLSLIKSFSASLQVSSLITLRTTTPPPPSGGNTVPIVYRELVLEEWALNPTQQIQSWNVPCTLPALSAESWTEGRLSPRYPWMDQVWFLCRNVPVNSPLATNPAPVDYMYLNEDGVLGTWLEEPLFPNGTNLINILPYLDQTQNLNIFYLLGGGSTGNGPSSPPRPPLPRIRVDTGPGTPPDAQGQLLSSLQGITINQLRILNKTLYGTGVFAGSTGIPGPTIFQIGSEGILPTATRNPVLQIPNFPLVLSVWTDPFSPIWWRTGFNRTAYIARYNNENGVDQVFPLPPSASAGTLGGASWSVLTARQEDQDSAVYLSNNSHILKNTLSRFQSGMPYQPVLQAPPGWRYLSAHARNPNIPSPTATATASATSSASATTTATSTESSSATATATGSASSTASATGSASASATATSSPTASASATTSRNPDISNMPSVSITPSATATYSNGSIPIPPNNNQAQNDALSPGAQTGISLGSIAGVCIAGFLMIKYIPSFQKLYIQKFGSSLKQTKKPTNFRKPISSDVPITISHNPHVLLQQRLEQLKNIQKQASIREANDGPKQTVQDRTKKQFEPVILDETV